MKPFGDFTSIVKVYYTNISTGQLTPRLNSGLECLAERMAGAPTPGSHVTHAKLKPILPANRIKRANVLA